MKNSIMVKTFVEMLRGFKYGVIKELDKIVVLLQIIFPVILIYISNSIMMILLLSVITVFITKYICNLSAKLNKTFSGGFPIPTHTFINKDNRGFININDDDLPEAIQYLCEVEEYLKKKGIIKH